MQVKKLKTLFKRTSKGQVQQWTIVIYNNTYWVEEGIQDGKITVSRPYICAPKNEGKANHTTASEQAAKEARAEWDKKKKRGYSETLADIDKTGFEKPMKGDTWKDRESEVVFPASVSDKLNGVRLRIKMFGDKLKAFSTGGEEFFTIPHIKDKLASLFIEYPDLVLDGEAFSYSLRENLNRLVSIVSVVRKEDDITPELLAESEKIVEFHIFDAYGYKDVNKEDKYAKRFESLQELLKPFLCKFIQIVEVKGVADVSTILKMLAANKKKGGEGLIIRWGDCPYKHGRSKYLLKLKHFDDDEFELVDLESGNGDWTGCAKRAILKAKNGETFCSNIHGDRKYLAQLLKDKSKVIGELATVEYQCLSEYGIPQLGWLKTIRNYE